MSFKSDEQISFFCPICNLNSINDESCLKWPRDYLACSNCGSAVRERSLFLSLILNSDYKSKIIHESSPSIDRSYHEKFKNECRNYTFSQYFNDIPNGEKNSKGILSANLENLPFTDESIDIFLSLDVFEHLWNPIKAFKEVYRVLKNNGKFILTFPIDNGFNKTEKPVTIENPNIIIPTKAGIYKGFTECLEYHGNPVDPNGSLVTYYYGYDIIEIIKKNTDFKVDLMFLHDIEQFGIVGVMNECFVLTKNEIISPELLSNTKKDYYNNLK